MIDDSYSSGVKHYDAAYSVKEDLVDRDFYLNLANEYGGPVLEFGCGTGRITLPLARQGVDVTGMDASHSMLDVLRAKLAKEHDKRTTENASYRGRFSHPLFGRSIFLGSNSIQTHAAYVHHGRSTGGPEKR